MMLIVESGTYRAIPVDCRFEDLKEEQFSNSTQLVWYSLIFEKEII